VKGLVSILALLAAFALVATLSWCRSDPGVVDAGGSGPSSTPAAARQAALASEHERSAPTERVDVHEAATAYLDPVAVVGAGPHVLEVEVVDAHGRAAVGAEVLWHQRPDGEPVATTPVAVDGQSRVEVSRGLLFARARHPDVGTSLMLALSTEHPPARTPRLALLRPCRIEGALFDEHGEPVAGAAVQLDGRLGIPFGHAGECVTRSWVRCDAHGRFAFEASYGTHGWLRFVDPEDAGRKVDVAFTAGRHQRVRLRLATGGEVVGSALPAVPEQARTPVTIGGDVRIEAIARAVPVERLQVSWRHPHDRPYLLREVEPRPSPLQLAKADLDTFVCFLRDPVSGWTNGLLPGELARSDTVVLLPPGPFRVLVHHDGRPARGVDVVLHPGGPSLRAAVGVDGNAYFAKVPAGPVLIHLLRGVELLGEHRARVGPDELASVGLVVELGIELRGEPR
jgi:hypothetical protein